MRVVLPLHHSGDVSKGHFPHEGRISTVLGHPELVSAHDLAFRRRQCWEQRALHISVKGSTTGGPFQESSRGTSIIITGRVTKPLMILINIRCSAVLHVPRRSLKEL